MSGICLCRTESCTLHHNDKDSTVFDGLSTTTRRRYESDDIGGVAIYTVDMPEYGILIGVSEEDFKSQFYVVCHE